MYQTPNNVPHVKGTSTTPMGARDIQIALLRIQEDQVQGGYHDRYNE